MKNLASDTDRHGKVRHYILRAKHASGEWFRATGRQAAQAVEMAALVLGIPIRSIVVRTNRAGDVSHLLPISDGGTTRKKNSHYVTTP